MGSVVIREDSILATVCSDSAYIEFDGGVSIKVGDILKLIGKLKATASEVAIEDPDNFCVSDVGNMDDAYYLGRDEGVISFAKEMLSLLNAKV